MIIIDKLNKNEIELLKKANIEVENKDYNDNEYIELEEKIYNAMVYYLDDKQDYTSIALEYEKIHDKLIKLED